MIHFTANVPPIPQPRMRHSLRSSKAGKQFIHGYTPAKKVKPFKAAIQAACRKAMGDAEPIEGPIHLSVTAVFPRTKGQMWKRRPMPRLRHDKKPDADNVLKACLDALNGIAWRDDAQVCELNFSKWIAAGGEVPHVTVLIAGA